MTDHTPELKLTSKYPGGSGAWVRSYQRRRVEACWNACAGIPTEQLGTGTLQQLADLLIRVHNTVLLDDELDAAIGAAIAPFHGED